MNTLFSSDSSWIHATQEGGPTTSAPAPFFRRKFSVNGTFTRAVCTFTARGLVVAELNGERIGDAELFPGWTDYRKRIYVQEVDVTGLLRPGDNAIGAVLGDGWYCGHVAQEGRQLYGPRPELRMELRITLDDGREQRVVSDEDWETAVGPILENDLFMGEAWDARKALTAWSTVEGEKGDWTPVQTGEAGAEILEFSPGPPTRVMEVLNPVSETRVPEGPRQTRRYDFGQNLVGRQRITVDAPAGTVLRFTFAERLNADGSLYNDNFRTARCTDVYICKGGGETWEPWFTFHGFQYMQISQLPAEADCQVEAVVLHSDLERTGEFACSNPLLNQLFSNIHWGWRGNALDVPTDCPQRDERLGWTGDAQAFAPTAVFLTDARRFFHKWMQDVRDAMMEEGGVPPVCPNPPGGAFKLLHDGGPGWADATVLCPWAVYQAYNDTAILEAHYPAMVKWLDYLDTDRTLDRIRSCREVDAWGGFGDWLALEYTNPAENDCFGKTPKDLIGTAFYALSVDRVARIADVLGKPRDAGKWRALHREIVEAFRNRFVTPDGLVCGNTQTADILALAFDLLPEDKTGRAVGDLVANLGRRGNHLGTGFLGTPYILDVLERYGHLDLAYELLEKESFPSWLFPVTQGATTIWERWDGWHPERGFQTTAMNSFNHYAYGAVGQWMVETAAGLLIRTGENGLEVCFKPRPGGTLTFAKASRKTDFGEVAIEWKKENGDLSVTLQVPEGLPAVFDPPQGWQAESGALTPGRHQFRS